MRSLVLLLSVVCALNATTIYSDFHSSSISSLWNGYELGCCTNLGNGYSQAFSFAVPGQTSYQLTEIDAALISQNFLAPSDTATISLYADSGGVPGNLLESITVPVPISHQLSSYPLSIATSAQHPQLLAGATYWVAVAPGVADLWIIDPSSTDMGFTATKYDNVPWTIPGDPFGGPPVKEVKSGFIVVGTPVGVPEPASRWLCAFGLSTFVVLRGWARSRHSA